MRNWQLPNRALYRLHYALRHLRAWSASAHARRAARAGAGTTPGVGGRPVLYLSWGRIGDTILSTAVTRHFRRWLGRPVVMLGRAECREVVAGHVDRYVPFAPERWSADAAYRREVLAQVAGEYEAAFGDLHWFHGGGFYFGALLDAVEARHKLVYEGWAGRDRLAPWRPWPRSATVIPSLEKRADGLEDRHVWHDLVHYTRAVLDHLGVREPLGESDLRPDLSAALAAAPPAADVLGRFGLEPGGFVACQPVSHLTKKDWPAAAWRRVFEALPDHTFALLGSPAEAARAAALRAGNVRDLTGRTTLGEALRLIAEAQAFAGLDSGLTHAAVALEQPAVCVSQSSNLGYFFPYPARLGYGQLRVVHNEAYRACSGCLMTCREEPIARTYRRGALCLRTLPPEPVIEALRRACEPACLVG